MISYKFPLPGRKSIKNLSEFEEFVTKNGLFNQERNREIFKKFFLNGPRRRLLKLIKKFRLDEIKVMDLGSGYGHVLVHLGEGSYGIDNKKEFVDFSNHLNLKSHHIDGVRGDLSHLPRVDAVIAWAVMEHVDSQHLFLRNIHSQLNGKGKVFLYVPTIPFWVPRLLPKSIRKYWEGHLHGDHVNAYSRSTLKFICERAGFKTIECHPGFSGLLSGLNYLPGMCSLTDGCVYIGEAIPNWRYPEGSTRSNLT